MTFDEPYTMPARLTRDRLSSLNRRELLALNLRLVDALGPRLAHRLVQNAPIEAPDDSVQLDLYAVNVFGVTSNLAESCQDFLRSNDASADGAAQAFIEAAKVLVSTISAAARSDYVDGASCALLLVDSALSARHFRPESPTILALRDEAERALGLLGDALIHHPSDSAFDEFLRAVEAAEQLLESTALRGIVSSAVHRWSDESRARLCEEWLRERSSWSSSAALVANAWSTGADGEMERQRVTDAVSIYLAESADVPLLLGRMHGRCGAIEDARYWLGEGQNRYPDDTSLEQELQRWS